MVIGKTLWEKWAETVFIILLLIGFALAITIQSIFLKYLIMFLIGMMVGRFIYEKKGKQPLFPFVMTIFGLLVGYMIGAYGANRKGLALLFIIGSVLSYYIHKKGYIQI